MRRRIPEIGQETALPSARSIAALVLARVQRDKAFASAALEGEMARAPQLAARDRALCTELVYGSLRVLPWLLAELDRHASRGIGSIDPTTRAHLCVSAYQLGFLSRVPAFAAVNEAVAAIKRSRGDKVAAFANAVLRKLAAEREARDAQPDAEAAREALHAEAIWGSIPSWIRRALIRSIGEDGARAFLLGAARPPPLGIRVEREEERSAILARLAAAAPDAEFEPGRVSPLAIVARGTGRPQALPGWEEGAWTLQEEGAQVVALALGARAGETVLDACAGRGNKTSLLARAVLPNGRASAADLHPNKLERLVSELARLHLAPHATYAVDWSVGEGECRGVFDRVLVDAPCSGLGTLRRRPELAMRQNEGDLAATAPRQRAILARTCERVAPRGSLLYAVCSVLREEGEEVVTAVLESNPSMERTSFAEGPARVLAGEAPTLLLLPHVHGTDGYFLATLRKKR